MAPLPAISNIDWIGNENFEWRIAVSALISFVVAISTVMLTLILCACCEKQQPQQPEVEETNPDSHPRDKQRGHAVAPPMVYGANLASGGEQKEVPQWEKPQEEVAPQVGNVANQSPEYIPEPPVTPYQKSKTRDKTVIGDDGGGPKSASFRKAKTVQQADQTRVFTAEPYQPSYALGTAAVASTGAFGTGVKVSRSMRVSRNGTKASGTAKPTATKMDKSKSRNTETIMKSGGGVGKSRTTNTKSLVTSMVDPS